MDGRALTLIAAALCTPALAGYEREGWRASLSTLAHGVSGTVTIVDADTVRVDDFHYDGGGLDVFFYLGAQNTNPAFQNGLPIGPQLLGTVYDGDSLVIDLPAGQTLDGFGAVSVWCVTASANFGSGSFQAPPCAADMDGDGVLTLNDFVTFRNLYIAGDLDADFDGSGGLTLGDFVAFRNAYVAGCP